MMRKKFLVFLILLFNHYTNAQWIATNGPKGGVIDQIFFFNNLILARAYSYNNLIFLSNDFGKSWKYKPTKYESKDLIINDMLFSNNAIYFTATGRIYKTDYSFENIQQLDTNIKTAEKLTSLENLIIAAGSFGDVFVSEDSGKTWIKRKLELLSTYKIKLKTDGRKLFIAPNNIFYESLDTGKTWKQSFSFYERYKYDQFQVEFHSNIIFIGTYDGFYRSTDSGFSWETKNKGLSDSSINCITLDNNKIYVGTKKGAYCSTDYGENWITIGMNDFYINSIIAKNDAIFVSSIDYNIGSEDNDEGIYYTYEGGKNWFYSNCFNTYVPSLHLSGNKIIAGTKRNGIQMSENEGEKWLNILDNDILATYITSFAKDSIIAVSSIEGVFISTDYGKSFVKKNNGITSQEIRTFTIIDKVIFSAYVDVFMTTDFGDSWTETNLKKIHINKLFSDNNFLYAGTSNGIYLSTDYGVNWTHIFKMDKMSITDIFANGSNIFFIDGLLGLFRSTNSGFDWDHLGFEKKGLSSLFSYKNFIFLGNHEGFYISSDNGDSWINKSEGLMDISSILVYQDYVYIGTNILGVFKAKLIDLLPTEITEEKENTAFEVIVYPIPATDRVTIQFKFLTLSNPKFELFNILGIKIQENVFEKYYSGMQTFNLQLDEFNYGLYFLKIDINGNSKTVKLIVGEK